MVRLVMRPARHEADKSKTADVLHLLRVPGCHGQQDTVRQRLGLGAPPVEMHLVNLVSLSRDHSLYRFNRPPSSGNSYFDAPMCHERTLRQPELSLRQRPWVDREHAFRRKKLSDVATIFHGVRSAILKTIQPLKETAMLKASLLAAFIAATALSPTYAASQNLCNDAHMKQMDEMIAKMTDAAKKKEATMHLDMSKAEMKKGRYGGVHETHE